nr:RibD C-terminal domain protein [uncultured bacterium]
MKVVIMAAVTLDGKIARDEAHFVDWTSREDKKLYYNFSKRAGVMIMGHNTYKTLPAPLPGRLHVVLTTELAGKENKEGVVEFTDGSPEEIVAGLEARGYTEAMLAGGAQVNALFLKSNMVDELWLTVEPLIFGAGIDLFRGVQFDLRGTLTYMERLNDSGSVHLRYSLK